MFTATESNIIRAINKSVKKNWQVKGPANWTRVIKQPLVNLGHKFHYKVCAAPYKKLHADYGEWLYDLCWTDEGNNWKDFRGLKLAVEIEWHNNPDHILHDFQKLTVGIANHRLMVVQYHENKTAQLERIIKLCKNACPRVRGSRYLFIAIPAHDPKNLLTYSWKF